MAAATIKRLPALSKPIVDSLQIARADDATKIVDLTASTTGGAVMTMTDGTMHLRSGGAYSYLQIQNTTTGQTGGTGDGFTIGANGVAGYLLMRDASSTLSLGVGGVVGISLDATRNATFVNNLSTNGNATLGDAGSDAHTLNGTLQFAEEVAAPSAPGAGDGGIFFVKDDGVPYYISDSTAETSLVGGGGITTTGTTLITADPSPAVAGTMYLCDSASAFNVTLPTAASAGNGGTVDVCKASGANDVTVLRAGSDTINGATSQLVSVLHSNVTLISDGTDKWYIR